ncbi:MAG TPA: ATP-dependent helicase HrpB [Candidatus Stackebrandtia excrementipullorum]|nr:ATP-dependent helicase HrpB [Candidatus Stackebrandtia excrementipullorum]
MTRRRLLPCDSRLPIVSVLPQVCATLRDDAAAVLVAPPGTGKTSLVPLALADEVSGRVIVAEPRRIATRAAAARMARLTGTRIGDEIGYTVRGERSVSRRTRVEVVTTGVLVRRLQNDPELAGVDAVVIDECHERHLDTDLACAFLTDVRTSLRDDLRILATSATAQADRLANVLGDERPAPVISADTLVHPLTVRWRPPNSPVTVEGLRVDRALLDHVAAVTTEALGETHGDVLVFLPGAAEIDQVARRLGHRSDVEVLRLHGRQSGADQDAALQAGTRRRVVLATSVAESSLTVPDVTVVVDAGLSRQPRMDHARGMGALVTVSVSKDSAVQRAGRAARLGPGVVYRCWSQAEHEKLPAHAQPEIATADLAGFMLQLAAWGTPEGRGLRLLDSPGEGPGQVAIRTLESLSAVDGDGRVTPRGARMAAMGTHPRLARALLDGAPRVGATAAAEVVAVMAESGKRRHDDLRVMWRHLRSGKGPESAAWRRETARLRKAIPETSVTGVLTDDETAATVAALAYPEWIARQRPQDRQEYLLASGTAGRLQVGSALAGAKWIVVVEAVRQPGSPVATIRLGAALHETTAIDIAGSLVTEQDEVDWHESDIRARRVRRLGALTLSSTTLTRPDPADVGKAVTSGFAAEGLSLVNFTRSAERLRQRIATCQGVFGETWPDVSTQGLRDNILDWLGPRWGSISRRADLRRIDMVAALRDLLDWRQLADLDRLVPERWRIPGGNSVEIDYSDPSAPVVRARVQEFFGCDRSPTVADGRLPVVVHLLSPAGRPAAVTADLASFWERGYRQVRAELRGRYPKHPWPEDPLQATPTSRAKPRRR